MSANHPGIDTDLCADLNDGGLAARSVLASLIDPLSHALSPGVTVRAGNYCPFAHPQREAVTDVLTGRQVLGRQGDSFEGQRDLTRLAHDVCSITRTNSAGCSASS